MTELTLKYRWGFEAYRTPFRYGLGIEVHMNGRFLIGGRIGSWLISFGQQAIYPTEFGTTK